MAWARIDDSLHEDEDLDYLHPAAIGLFVMMVSYSAKNLTDGVVPLTRVRRLPGYSEDALLSLSRDAAPGNKPWITLAEDHATIRSYTKYNPTKTAIDAKKTARSDAGKRGASTRWKKNSVDPEEQKWHLPCDLPSKTMAIAIANGPKTDGNCYSKCYGKISEFPAVRETHVSGQKEGFRLDEWQLLWQMVQKPMANAIANGPKNDGKCYAPYTHIVIRDNIVTESNKLDPVPTKRRKAPPPQERFWPSEIFHILPVLLQTDVVQRGLDDYTEIRKAKRYPQWLASQVKTIIKNWAEYEPDEIAEALQKASMGAYRGVFPQHRRKVKTPSVRDAQIERGLQ